MAHLADYGSQGLIGVLTPQANTTVEPELWALLPAGWSMLNARLTSDCNTIVERLVDYTTKFEATAEQFANAPVEAIVIACTGASYLIGADNETAITESMNARYGVPVLTAAQAATAALNELGAKRIALLSPYPESLNNLSAPYWEAQGFEIVAKTGPELESEAFHPIYAMATEGVYNAYQRLSNTEVDAVLMLGTGMATLAPILRGNAELHTPAISCNLALVWAAVSQIERSPSNLKNLRSWLDNPHWVERLRVMFG